MDHFSVGKYLVLYLEQKVMVSPSFSHQKSYSSNSNFRPFIGHSDYVLAKPASSSVTGTALPSENNFKNTSPTVRSS